MATSIELLILAIVCFIVGKLAKKAKTKKRETIDGVGIIEKVTYDETGDVNYYVSFIHENNKILGKSIIYSSSTKTLKLGEQVNISYYFIDENKARVIINSDKIISYKAKNRKENNYVRIF